MKRETSNEKILHADHLTAEEFALDETTFIDNEGRERTVKYLNRAKLITVHRERRERGRELTKEFRAWLIQTQALSARQADDMAAYLFNALWETKNKPWDLYENDDIAPSRRNSVKRAVNFFAQYILENKHETAENIRWAHEAVRRDRVIRARKKAEASSRHRRKKVRADAETLERRRKHRARYMTLEQEQAVFDAIDAWHKGPGVVYPWARWVFRIAVIAGIVRAPDVLCTLSRWEMKHALKDNRRNAVFRVRAKKNFVRLIPITMIRPEIKGLVAYPAPWKLIVNLFGLHEENEETLLKSGSYKMSRLWSSLANSSNDEVRKMLKDATLLRNSAIKRIWDRTGDLAIVASALNMSIADLKKLEFISKKMTVD